VAEMDSKASTAKTSEPTDEEGDMLYGDWTETSL
jgi:hypothetical protein